MKRFQTLFSVAWVATASAPAWAAPIFDVDFQSDTVGSPPVVAASVAGVTNTHPTTAIITGTGSINTRLVQDGYEALGGSGDKVLVVSDTDTTANNNFSIQFFAANADAISSGTAVYSWDMLASSTAARAGNLFLTISNSSSVAVLSLLTQASGASNELMILSTYTSSGGVVNASPNYTFARGAVQHVDVALDMDAKTADVYVNSNLKWSVSIAYKNGGAPTDNVARWTYSAGYLSTATGTYALDNFVFDVPEPASMALMAMGGALVLVRGKR
ncbi:MAG: PEP-CTERM sorting domain-containing protein [Phycisphaerales bacterium]